MKIKNILIYSFFIGLLLITTSCTKDGLSTVESSNPKIKVELLLEHDGCKVYRFRDSSLVYFTKCGETASEVTCGKNCTTIQQNFKMKEQK